MLCMRSSLLFLCQLFRLCCCCAVDGRWWLCDYCVFVNTTTIFHPYYHHYPLLVKNRGKVLLLKYSFSWHIREHNTAKLDRNKPNNYGTYS